MGHQWKFIFNTAFNTFINGCISENTHGSLTGLDLKVTKHQPVPLMVTSYMQHACQLPAVLLDNRCGKQAPLRSLQQWQKMF